jgi:cytochrome b involved in lipid metabolism
MRVISKEELAQHGPDVPEPWMAIKADEEKKAKVYDLSSWYRVHPGGPEALFEYFGKDATQGFAEDAGHGGRHLGILEPFCLGWLGGESELEQQEMREVSEQELQEKQKIPTLSCAQCGKSEPAPDKICSRCKLTRYCSRSCQSSGELCATR